MTDALESERKAAGHAFETSLLVLPVADLLPSRVIKPIVKRSDKYKRILSSIQEIGIIEPIVVYLQSGGGSPVILDGHLRVLALQDLSIEETRCLAATTEEAYTYNRRVNRLAPIQEHYMILRAIERGVSEERIARALNVDVDRIRRKRNLLNGISPKVVEMLKDRVTSQDVFDALRRVRDQRQIDIVELMILSNNFTGSYARALVMATPAKDMAPDRVVKSKTLTAEQLSRMEKEVTTLQAELQQIEDTYGEDVLNLVLAQGYVRKLIANTEVRGYLEQYHPAILEEFVRIADRGREDALS